jgi:EAL domain-containing protein (putative c-di-GMP-specific phosphodiesterase class I)
MTHRTTEQIRAPTTFGRGKVKPRVCVADTKQHIRTFLREALEELGFIACECAQIDELEGVLAQHLPDLLLLGFSDGGAAAGAMLEMLAAQNFDGKVLLIGPRDALMVAGAREHGEGLGVAMLPTLVTPFSVERLRDSLALFLPIEVPPAVPVGASEAVRAGWLELWYQPKITARTLALREAEGLIRIRHPTWGIVPPAYFVPDDGDPHLRGLSEFVIGRVIDDWRYFVAQRGPIDLAVNLPVAFLQDPEAAEHLCQQMPDHPSFGGLIIEINGTEVVRNLELVKRVARRLRFHKIAISIDDLGGEWPSLVGLDNFPFVELKVDRKFIAGCADDRLKRAVCRQILDLAEGYGARTVAKGVETRADFLVVREMGFDLVQGFLFAKPLAAKKFARTILSKPVTLQH